MGEEERVGLASLASSRRRPAGDDRLALAGRPEVVRRRSPFTVGAGAAGEALSGEPGAAVAQRPRGRLGIDRGELGLGQHPVGGEEVEDAEVEIGERRGLGPRNENECGERQRVRRGPGQIASWVEDWPLTASAPPPPRSRRLRWRPAVRAGTARRRCLRRGGEEPPVAGAETIAVAPSVIAAAEAERRCGSQRGGDSEASRAMGASRGAATGTRSRSTHRQLTASRVGRESGAGEGPRSRDAMRERRAAQLASRGLGGWQGRESSGQRRPRRISAAGPCYRCVKEAHAPTSSSTLGGSQVACPGMRGDVLGFRPGASRCTPEGCSALGCHVIAREHYGPCSGCSALLG